MIKRIQRRFSAEFCGKQLIQPLVSCNLKKDWKLFMFSQIKSQEFKFVTKFHAPAYSLKQNSFINVSKYFHISYVRR